jgi:hypothetical protein
LAAVRTVPDREVRRLQVHGSARLSAFLRGQIGSTEDRLLSVQRTREVSETLRSSKARTAVVAWLAVLLVVAVGSRDLLVGHIAAIGDMPVLGDSALDLVRTWASGYRSVGLGAVEANPTGIGFIGALGLVVFSAMQLLTKVLVLGLLPLGAAGMWRLTKPVGSRRSRIVALVVYVAIPLPYNAIANGQWTGLVAYAFVPWVLGQLAKASGIAPFGDIGGERGPGVRARPMLHRVIAVGVLAGLASMASASLMGLTIALAVALAVGGAIAGTLRGAGRVLLVGVAGTVVALVLQLPWSTTFVAGDWRALTGSTTAGDALDLGAILRFESGPLGAGLLSYLFLAAAALPLVIGRSWRLGWAVRAWALVLASFAAVLAQSEGWLSFELPAAELLLVPAAVGVAVAAGMGMAAFEVDLPDYHFGWRQILSVLAGAALVLAVMPMLGATVDGRWEMPRGDYARALTFVNREGDETPFRVLWMGEASVLPLASWPLDEQAYGEPPHGEFAYATSDNGTPSLDDRWPERGDGATDQLGDVLAIAGEGGTSRLGALLAPMGVRYIVVPLGVAPEPAPVTSQPDTVLATLDAQLDLAPVTTAGVVLYRNNAWGPTRARLPAGTEAPSGGPALADRLYPAVEGAPIAVPDTDGVERFSGSIDEPSEVYLAEAASDRWELVVDGTEAARDEVLGWSNQFQVENTGSAELRFATPTTRYLVLAGQVLLWVVALVFLLRVRVVRDESRSLEPTGTSGVERT